MRENVGRTDRIVRSILGSGLVTLGLYDVRDNPVRGVLAAMAGAILVETAITRVCPLNAVIGLDTRSTTEKVADFRADVDEQTERITTEYAQPIAIDGAIAPA